MSAPISQREWVCVFCLIPFRLASEPPKTWALWCPICGEKQAIPYVASKMVTNIDVGDRWHGSWRGCDRDGCCGNKGASE